MKKEPKCDYFIEIQKSMKRCKKEMVKKLSDISTLSEEKLNSMSDKELADMWKDLGIDNWVNLR
jgi:hypothetical protein